jgi:hypothetical protein
MEPEQFLPHLCTNHRASFLMNLEGLKLPVPTSKVHPESKTKSPFYSTSEPQATFLMNKLISSTEIAALWNHSSFAKYNHFLFAKYTLKFLKLPYEKPKERIILTYGMLSEFLGHLHFCQHLESATTYISSKPLPPKKKKIDQSSTIGI